ncbi:MAG: hypothetical protein H0T80_05605 [Betaproteobacteria bacterium]|nr:hypothetical protein [Betaproteobacteria bacterium]
MRISLAISLSVFAATLAGAAGAVTTTVVDVPTRGTNVRILYLRPDAPVANVVIWPGGEGFLGIQSDGTMTTELAACNPAVRNRQALADHGYAVAVVDVAFDGAPWNYADMLEVVRYLQARDQVPTWAIGGSTATQSTVDLVARLPLANGLGAVFYSNENFTAAQAALITRPSLVVYHPSDSRNRGAALFNALTSAPAKQQVTLTGGNNSGCAGYHTLNGLNGPFLAAIFGFIDLHNPTLVYTPLGQSASAVAVEYYNVELDHYFLTHLANEIAILDAGVTIKGWARTLQSFKVYPAAQTGTSPVCRYYIPPNKGDSHFYGRGTAECDATGRANPSFVNEDPQFFHVLLPSAGACPAGTIAVYRVFSNRADANHRYLVSRSLRDQMVGRAWLAEGDGPDLVVMCAPA